MRENTGRQIITTVNFANDQAASHEWTQDEVRESVWVIDAYADQHEAAARRTEYVLEFGYPQVFEYREAGLYVVALLNDGQLASVFVIEEADIARYHTAARTGRTMKLRYVKPEGDVSLREVEVTSVRLTKAGKVVVRAFDRKADDTRSFRADRISHATLHRATVPVRPTKAALAAAFQAEEGMTGRVHNVSRSYSGTVVPGSRAFSASGWSVVIELDAEFAHLTPSGSVRDAECDLLQVVALPAPRRAVEESASWHLYDTHPDTPAALEAPESVQDTLAEAFASGHRYVKIYA
jgi:hypothetical protein